MKSLLVFFVNLTVSISAYSLETVIGGQRYSCDPINTPREQWYCSVDLSFHGGGVHTGVGYTRSQAATEARSSCHSSEGSVLKNLCGMPPQCEQVRN
ncbi:MAG: hypothetical protein ACK5V3_09815 [Bdellovibrionales bacterium]